MNFSPKPRNPAEFDRRARAKPPRMRDTTAMQQQPPPTAERPPLAAPVMGCRDWVMLLCLSVLWGGSFFFYKILAPAIPPLTVVLGRATISALLLNAVLAARGERLRLPLRRWVEVVWLAFLTNALPFALFAWSEHHISSGLASVLNATTPIFAVLVAASYGIERLRAGRLAGILLGLAGTLVVVGPEAIEGLSAGLGGEAACLAASVCYGFGGIYARRFSNLSPLQVTTGQSTASAVLLLPAAAIVERPWSLPMPGPSAWAALFGIVILSTVVAYLIYFRLLARTGPTNVSLVTLLVPVSALLLGAVFLAEPIRPQAVAGMGLIALGLAAIDGRMFGLVAARVRRSEAP